MPETWASCGCGNYGFRVFGVGFYGLGFGVAGRGGDYSLLALIEAQWAEIYKTQQRRVQRLKIMANFMVHDSFILQVTSSRPQNDTGNYLGSYNTMTVAIMIYTP